MKRRVKTKKITQKKTSGLMKFLEAIVVIGAAAGLLVNFFKGSKKKK